MPISSNSLLDWTDIQAIYTNLNIAKTNFNQSTVSIPNNENQYVLTTHLSNLVSQIEAMKSITKIGDAATVGVTIPSRGDLIKPIEFSRAATVAETISRICNFDGFNAAHYTTCFTFRAFDGFDGFDDFDDFDGHRDFDSGFRDFDSDNSFDNFDFCFTFAGDSFFTGISFGSSC